MANRIDALVIAAGAACVTAVVLQGAAAQAQAPAQGGRGTAAGPPTATRLTSPVTGNAARGRQLYYEYACYSCHGYNGETGARAFVPNWPANLATERSFIAYLRGRAGVAPVQPSTGMPNYPEGSLSDAQARDIYAYIRSFKSSAPPLEKIPVMQQILAGAKEPYTP